MSDFLNRDKAGFIAYAVRVAQIVVKQAKAMEIFNKGQHKNRTPLVSC
jgi:hypothetical protein